MRCGGWAATGVLALVAAGPAWSAPRLVAFNLPALPARVAIPEFARQAGLQVIAPTAALEGVVTPPLRGVWDAPRALDILIAGSGLEVASFEGATVVLRRRTAAASSPDPPRPRPEAAPAASGPGLPVEVDALAVVGGGQARQTQLVRGEAIDRQLPGAGPLQLVARLPGVNLTSADSFGANEWSTRFSVRSFNQGRLGFTLDEIPLGDMTYGNHNGLHIARAISTENIASVQLAAGPGALQAASSSNLGGVVAFRSRDPAPEAQAFALAAAGSDDTARVAVRLDSGDLGDGLRGYASYAETTTRRWQGAGRQTLRQVNLKAVRPLLGGEISGLVTLSRRRESDPQDLSLGMIGRLGLGWDNIAHDWRLAVRVAEVAANRGDTGVAPRDPEAGTRYPAPFADVDDAYYDSTTLRDDVLAGLTLRLPVGRRLQTQGLVYGHWDRGQGLWWTPYVASPNYGVRGAPGDDAPISIRATEYDIRRRGLVASATATFGDHRLSAGVWAENNDFVQARRFYGLDLAAPQRRSLSFQSGAFRTDWVYRFRTETRQTFVEDAWDLGEDLRLTGGFKALSVTNRAVTRVGEVKDGAFAARSPFLPRVGLRWRVGPSDELFANYGRGMRAFASSNTSGPFAASAAALRARRGKLRPELSDSYEIGWRRSRGATTLLVAAYDAQFHNRLFSTPVGGGILGNPLVLANVGGVSAYGVETMLTQQLSPSFRLQAAYSYNRATYDDDVFDGDGVRIARTRGKDAVDAPRHLLRAQLAYEGDSVFAEVGVAYVGPRYFTFENDQRVAGEALVDAMAGYRFPPGTLLSGVTAQVQVSNLLDRRYVATIGSNDFPIRGDAQTLLAGPPRQVLVSLRKVF